MPTSTSTKTCLSSRAISLPTSRSCWASAVLASSTGRGAPQSLSTASVKCNCCSPDDTVHAVQECPDGRQVAFDLVGARGGRALQHAHGLLKDQERLHVPVARDEQQRLLVHGVLLDSLHSRGRGAAAVAVVVHQRLDHPAERPHAGHLMVHRLIEALDRVHGRRLRRVPIPGKEQPRLHVHGLLVDGLQHLVERLHVVRVLAHHLVAVLDLHVDGPPA